MERGFKMFEVYTKEVEIKEQNGNTQKYTIRPLNGDFLPDLYHVMGKFEESNDDSLSDKEKNAKIFASLDKETVSILHKLTLETLKKSYPDKEEGVLNEFASQNLLPFMGAIMEVNVNNEQSD